MHHVAPLARKPSFCSNHVSPIRRKAIPALVLLTSLCANALAASDYVYIGGNASANAVVGQKYWFHPWLSASSPSKVTFHGHNLPGWASLDSKSGSLSGTPAASAVGTYKDISITATDGVKTSTIPSITIKVSTSGAGKPPTTPPSSPPPAPPGNSAPQISGTPATSVVAGALYSFQPSASDANGDKLTFSVKNAPSWASFSATSGKLSGTPTTANVGTTSNIMISVTDGKASASLAPFALTVGSASTTTGSVSLSWTPPTENTNGTALTDLAGYRIMYGTSASSLSSSIQVSNPGLADYVVQDLAPATYYFEVVAYTTTGTQSPPSAVASATIH